MCNFPSAHLNTRRQRQNKDKHMCRQCCISALWQSLAKANTCLCPKVIYHNWWEDSVHSFQAKNIIRQLSDRFSEWMQLKNSQKPGNITGQKGFNMTVDIPTGSGVCLVWDLLYVFGFNFFKSLLFKLMRMLFYGGFNFISTLVSPSFHCSFPLIFMSSPSIRYSWPNSRLPVFYHETFISISPSFCFSLFLVFSSYPTQSPFFFLSISNLLIIIPHTTSIEIEKTKL